MSGKAADPTKYVKREKNLARGRKSNMYIHQNMVHDMVKLQRRGKDSFSKIWEVTAKNCKWQNK